MPWCGVLSLWFRSQRRQFFNTGVNARAGMSVRCLFLKSCVCCVCAARDGSQLSGADPVKLPFKLCLSRFTVGACGAAPSSSPTSSYGVCRALRPCVTQWALCPCARPLFLKQQRPTRTQRETLPVYDATSRLVSLQWDCGTNLHLRLHARRQGLLQPFYHTKGDRHVLYNPKGVG